MAIISVYAYPASFETVDGVRFLSIKMSSRPIHTVRYEVKTCADVEQAQEDLRRFVLDQVGYAGSFWVGHGIREGRAPSGYRARKWQGLSVDVDAPKEA